MYKLFLKRYIDFTLALIGLLALSPLFFLVILAVRSKLGSPIFFMQKRPGFKGNIFTIYKFRTMTNDRYKNGKLKPINQRCTIFGQFLRSTSLDELPELWNVLKGDMSIVGPRPLLKEYLPLYSQEQARRHDTRPGITGWAQVNGRNALSWSKKFILDLWYVENQSFFLDMKIIFLTIKKVLFRENINHNNSTQMPKFKGNSKNDT
tara:strand:+ start:775 stop:1392 length:618 start_codon:yes stop_codon:yes gene_type:complete